MTKLKIMPCKKCGSKAPKLWECGYNTFNLFGGECVKCGYKSSTTGCADPTENDMIRAWNAGQASSGEEELLKALKALDKTLVKMLRAGSIIVNKDFITARTNYLAAIAKAEGK